MKLIITETQWKKILDRSPINEDYVDLTKQRISNLGNQAVDKVTGSKVGRGAIKKGVNVAQDVGINPIPKKEIEISPELKARFSDIDIEKSAPNLTKMLKSLSKDDADAFMSQYKEHGTTDTPVADLETAGIKKNEMLHPLGVKAHISSGYGMRMHPTLNVEKMHNGVDIDAESGTPIYAPLDGIVTKSLDTTPDPCGGHIRIDHGKVQTKYCHLRGMTVKSGEKVKKGQHIGYTGGGGSDPMRGRSTGSHLHYEILNKNDQVLNPVEVSPSLV